MLSVVIPTQNSEAGLARTLAALVPAAAEGIIREVVVIDEGSGDGTAIVAEAAGCTFLPTSGSFGERVDRGLAAIRRAPWLMVLPPDVVLEGDWYREVAAFVERAERGGQADRLAGIFRLEYDAYGLRARLAERAIGLCSALFGLPTPEQGLVLSRRLWDRVRSEGPLNGHQMLAARIGRRRIHVLRANAVVMGHDGQRVPSIGRLATHGLAAIGLPVPSLGR